MHMFFRRLQRKKWANRLAQLLEFVDQVLIAQPLLKPSEQRIDLQTALQAADGPQRLLLIHAGFLFRVKEEAVIAQ